jgi:transposase
MTESLSQPAPAEPEFAAFIAIDWADQKHYWTLRAADSHRIERGELDNTPEAVEVWMAQMRQRFAERPLAVALEQRRGALVCMLSKYAQLHIYPVHPLALAKYREAWFPSGAKDDPKDADLLNEILYQHRDRLRRLDPDTLEMRRLQFQVENRRKLVDQRTAVSNRLTDLLKIYFPQMLSWFKDVTAPVIGDLLSRWPTLEALQKAKPATLEKFFRQHHCWPEDELHEHLAQIRQAIPATHDEAVIESAQTMVQVYVQQIATFNQAIHKLDRDIEALAKHMPDWDIFDSLPGAGKVMAPRLMAALGSRRERFHSADDLACFSGIAPVKEASGNTQWVHFRRACPKFMRQTFHEWAACSLPFCPWAKAYYDEQRAKKKSHHTAVRALAFKWMRILYRCWQDHQPYREQVYLASRAQRAIPLRRVAQAVQMP